MGLIVYSVADAGSAVVWEEDPGAGCAVGSARAGGKEFLFYSERDGERGSCFGTRQGALLGRLFAGAGQMGNSRPILYFFHCYGADLGERTAALDSYARVFREFEACGEAQLHIAVVFGSCVGGSAYLAGMSDVILFSRDRGNLCLTGPKVVRAFMGEDCPKEELGGSRIHSGNGTAARLFEGTDGCREEILRLLSAFYREACPPREPELLLTDSLAPMPNRAYDIKRIIRGIADRDTFAEFAPDYAGNLVIGTARIGGASVGIMANQPLYLAGTLDCGATEKGTRFLKQCRKLRLPLLVISDVPSFLPGREQEEGGIELKGGRFLKAMIRLDTKKVTLILHKSFGGAYIAMNSLGLGASKVYAWPGSTIGIMGESMARALSRDPDRWDEDLRLSGEEHARMGWISGVLSPEDTREKLIWEFAESGINCQEGNA